MSLRRLAAAMLIAALPLPVSVDTAAALPPGLQPGVVTAFWNVAVASPRRHAFPMDPPAFVRVDPVFQFLGPGEVPLRTGPAFYARWTALVRFARSGVYGFRLIGTGGFRLTVAGTPVLDNWRAAAGSTRPRDVSIARQGWYPLVIEAWHAGRQARDARMVLEWAPPNTEAFAPIPAELLAHRVQGGAR
jgi:hypothetical protein